MASKNPNHLNLDEDIDNDMEEDVEFTSAKVNDDTGELPTVASRARLRHEMNDAVAAFLANGGKINQIDSNLSALPPIKPMSEYGNRPI